MGGDVDELIIPVRFSDNNAIADLKRVEAAGTSAGNAAAGGMDKASAAAKGFGSELGGIMKAQIGLSAIRQVAAAMGSEFKRSAEEVARMAKQFGQVRDSMQQVASLSGRQNSNQFTVEQSNKAQRRNDGGGVDPGPGRIPEPRRGADLGARHGARARQEDDRGAG